MGLSVRPPPASFPHLFQHHLPQYQALIVAVNAEVFEGLRHTLHSRQSETFIMGRSNKNKRKNNAANNNSSNKRQAGPNKKVRRNEREWIFDCQDSKPLPEGESYDIELLVTRIVLQDGYGKKAKIAPKTNNENNDEEDTKNSDEEKQHKLEPKKKKSTSKLKAKGTIPIISIESSAAVNLEGSKESSSAEASKNDSSAPPKVGIKKSNNAKRPMPKFYADTKHYTPLPNGDCGDGIVNPHSTEEVPDKYWSQRHRFFTLFDKGIQLDKESWYSVTPEAIANHIASHLVGNKKEVVVLDPFCGCGGNAIAFAAQSGVKQVVCMDVDIEKLKKAYHNASIYGVQEKLLLVHGNAYEVLSRYKDGKLIKPESKTKHHLPTSIDVIFLSPPWGGIDYGKVGKHGFDLTCIKIDGVDGRQFNGEELLQFAVKALGKKEIAYFLPKNINGIAFSVSALKAGYTAPIVMEQNVLNGKLKTVTSYLGLGGE